MIDLLDARCGCDDCEAATSPGAYLASLGDYVLKHVTNNGAKIDLEFLAARFHQPFADLSLDCEAIERRVRQVRLAVETLRSYLGPRPVAEPASEAQLVQAEASYRLEVYTQLLTLLGATYEEVRRARSAAAPDRLALAERLGIGLTPSAGGPRNDELDRLLLEPALPATDERALTERKLEQLFGLGDTARDPLSEGVKNGDAQSQLRRWNLDGASLDRNTDAAGLVHLSLFKYAPDAYGVIAYKDVARGNEHVVASGEGKAPVGAVRLSPANGSGLSGVVDINYVADETDISVTALPAILVWRLRHLEGRWLSEDWPADAAAAPTPLPPLIDPEVIGLADLRGARPGSPTFDLWLARRTWLGAQRATLKTAREAAPSAIAGLEAIVALGLSTAGQAVNVATLDALAAAQQTGERIESRLRELGLSPGGFAFLLPIVKLVRDGQTVVDVEWEAVYDTLALSRKEHEFSAWRAEEQAHQLALSPNHFVIGDSGAAPARAVDPAVAFWLSTREARRAWLDVLEARIAQVAGVVAAVAEAVGTAEQASLPQLRDALLAAADAEGSSPVERAEWLTQRLLIDLRMSGLQVTTRVAQALETLQELLFSLRTGQLEQDTLRALAPLESICAVAGNDERIDVFGRATDDVLWHRVFDGTRWRSWRPLGPLPGAGTVSRPSNPAVTARADGGIDVLVRGGDRVLWHRRHRQGGWLDWARAEDDLELTGHPSVVATGPNELIAAALRINDLQVMQSRFDGTTWSAWEAVGADSSRSVAVASWGSPRLDIVRGRPAPDLFKPAHRWWDGVAWQDEPLDGFLFGDPAAVGSDVDRLDVFQNYAGHLWQKTWDGAWQPWADLDAAMVPGGLQLNGTPSACSRAPGTIDVFALRSGGGEGNVWRRHFEGGAWSEWEQLPSDKLELKAPDFDAEWEWIGGYSTWRAATFVRLYPENLLLPSLISRQTRAFRALVEQSRPTRRITPRDARALAKRYADYLREVTSLEIQATCQVETKFDLSTPYKTTALVGKHLVYMFGQTTLGKVYWSSYDLKDKSGFAQSFWEQVPIGDDADEPKVMGIIGALPWLDRDVGQHHVYLFLDVREADGRKLRVFRFDLDSYGREGVWSPGAILDLPAHPMTGETVPPNRITIVPVQSDTVVDPPRLAIHEHLTSFRAYIRPLNATGDGWEGSATDWGKYEIAPKYWATAFDLVSQKIAAVYAALRVADTNWLVYSWEIAGSKPLHVAKGGGSSWQVLDHAPRFRGALPGSDTFFLFYDVDDQTIYRHVRKDGTLGPEFIPAAQRKAIARHSGSYFPTFFAVPNKNGHSYGYPCRALGDELQGSAKLDLVPVLGSLHDVPVGLPIISAQARRNNIRKVYEDNKAASAAILAVLKEAYRLVPQQLALGLQASGEFTAALDWFLMVYDYRVPHGQRYIDYGLAIDAGLPDTAVYQNPEDWLLDPLNPHAIALTRRYAHTRFTIAQMIRCLNDFADAQFTVDTDESLTRARLLYTTALELCDAPELRQRVDVCEELIGALIIQPGTVVPPEVAAALGEIAEELTLGKVPTAPGAVITLEKMKALVQSDKPWSTVIAEIQALKTQALSTVPPSFSVGTAVLEGRATPQTYASVLVDPAIERKARLAGEIAVAAAFQLADIAEPL